ncbi:four-helix bundle copper-binding protein [Aquabacterium sp.]|uniref:four-helix bundle copper-binding protein n=1 Tax=Aquabacterium sp. TaxID=1872578 RepID=UPI0035B28B0E
MNRRIVIGSVGFAAFAGLARSALAQHEHHDHAGASAPVNQAPSKFAALVAATSDCAAKGQACLAHCIALLSDGDKSLGKCAKTVSQVVPLCTALQNLAAQDSSYTRALAKVALDACIECAEACKPHAEHHAQCKACYESCLECIKQCKAVL